MVVELYACPSLSQCAWQGHRHEIIAHFQALHVELLLKNNQFRITVPSFDNTARNTISCDYKINYLLCNPSTQEFYSDVGDDDEIYLVQIKVVDGKATIQIRSCGSQNDARKKRYSIQVRSGDMMQQSNKKSTEFYTAVRKQAGCIEIDTMFLRNVWQVDNFLTCIILFENLTVTPATSVELISNTLKKKDNMLRSKSLGEINSIKTPLEESAEIKIIEQKTSNKSISLNMKKSTFKEGAMLTRSASEQSSNRSSKIKSRFGVLKARSFHKSDMAQFYTDRIFVDASKVDSSLKQATDNGVIVSPEDNMRLKSRFRCGNCEIYIVGPLYRCCNNQHSVCHACIEEINACPCPSELSTELRNFSLEKQRDDTYLPCRFDGCMVTMLGSELQEHQVQCNHCVYMCPECMVCIGKYGEVEKHFRIVHPSIKRVSSLENAFPSKTTLLVFHPKGVFYCKSKEEVGSIVWQVEHCGHVKIYFECEVVGKKNRFMLTATKEPNILRRSISMKEKDKKSGNLLKIKVYDAYKNV